MNKRTPPKKRQSDFRLPRGVSMHKEPLPSGWAYVLRHKELGLLGRLILHGLLHLMGYDHETDHGEMRAVEHRLRRRFQC